MIVDLSINAIQLLALRWVADGADTTTPPTPDFKTSAVALANRGLIDLDRRRGHWRAALTEQGRFYLEHGRHPAATPTIRITKSLPPRQPSSETPPAATADVAPAPGSMIETRPPKTSAPTVPIPSQIRAPHPAIKELVDYPQRLDVPSEVRRRAHLILHALAQEAVRRGWTITPVLSQMTRDGWTGKRSRTWPSSDLFSLDAGSAPAAVRLRMKQRQVDHVPTQKELADEERYGYRRYPRHDFVPTDKMRLEVGAGVYGSLVLEDTVATRIEDKLMRAIERVERMTEDARARAEAQRLRAIEEAARQQRAAEFRARALRYDNWARSLDDLRESLARHRDLTNTVTALRRRVAEGGDVEETDRWTKYLTWAEQHLEESDPVLAFLPPEGETPDLTFAQWHEWSVQDERRYPQPPSW